MTTRNTPGWSGTLPDPAGADGATNWAEPIDYPRSTDGAAPWASADEPAGVPPVVAEGPHTRPGWLNRGRPGTA